MFWAKKSPNRGLGLFTTSAEIKRLYQPFQFLALLNDLRLRFITNTSADFADLPYLLARCGQLL